MPRPTHSDILGHERLRSLERRQLRPRPVERGLTGRGARTVERWLTARWRMAMWAFCRGKGRARPVERGRRAGRRAVTRSRCRGHPRLRPVQNGRRWALWAAVGWTLWGSCSTRAGEASSLEGDPFPRTRRVLMDRSWRVVHLAALLRCDGHRATASCTASAARPACGSAARRACGFRACGSTAHAGCTCG
jgi:hypothetical protein